MQVDQFRRDLLAWFRVAKRDLPWRRTRDPYAIWVSETMLQQTRVSAAIPYYERFLARFPTVTDLADAPEGDLLSAWAGLGYYYRARNLQKAARLISEHGTLPSTYEGLLALPGVGEYTAAAVASIAFGSPHAVVDGNVLRVLSRVCLDSTDIASQKGRKHFTGLANQMLDAQNPGRFNEAVMELGATICLPKAPQCLVCPVQAHCEARKQGRQPELPVKSGNVRQVEESRTLFWTQRGRHVLAWKRPADARLMPGFWELPEATHVAGMEPVRELGRFRHSITFHRYQFAVVEARLGDARECEWLNADDLSRVPISTVFKKALRVVHAAASEGRP